MLAMHAVEVDRPRAQTEGSWPVATGPQCDTRIGKHQCPEPAAFEILDGDHRTGFLCGPCEPAFEHMFGPGSKRPRPWLRLRRL